LTEEERVTATTVARRSRENTCARLVEAAADVFAEKALRRVTVDDLVGAAGFTRGAFYSNFGSIEELFFEVYAEQADLMLSAVRAAIDAIPPTEFSLTSMRSVLGALHPFGRRWFLIHNEFTLLAVRDEVARERFTAHGDRLQMEMVDLVARVLALLEREPVVSVEHLTDVLLALYVHSLGNEQLGTGNLDPDRLVDEVLPHILLGLSRTAA
jgi:AcrR family transcriptional regulator